MDKYITDTSVWIDFSKGVRNPHTSFFKQQMEYKNIYVCGLIQAEIVPFVPRPQKKRFLRNFSAVPVLPDPPDLWQRVASFQTRLAEKGFQGSIPDLVICVAADFNEAVILTKDKLFDTFSQYLPVRVFKV